MAKLSEVTATEMLWQEGSAPSTPASTKWKVYFKTDGVYVMDDAGAEIGPLGAATGSYPVPWYIAPASGAANITNRTIGASNRAIYVPVVVPQDCTITGVQIVVGTSSGNISAGMYSGTSRVATSGATACPAAGVQTVAFSASYAATAGRFYLALSADNNTATFAFSQQVSSGVSTPPNSLFEASAHPLPSTASMTPGISTPSIIGMVSGGYP